jgi:hypothetical protein
VRLVLAKYHSELRQVTHYRKNKLLAVTLELFDIFQFVDDFFADFCFTLGDTRKVHE